MPRIKNTAVRKGRPHSSSSSKLLPGSSSSGGGGRKAAVMKKIAEAAKKAKILAAGGVIHTGKLNVPFRPAHEGSIANAKKGLLKQLKRRLEFIR